VFRTEHRINADKESVQNDASQKGIPMASVSLLKIIDKMKLENLTPEIDLSEIKITQPDINRPALQLAGYFEHYEATRLQIIGFVEYTYMQGLSAHAWYARGP
jgi:serine kinase of HPr protein (carbohydrate metabolism regulator)